MSSLALHIRKTVQNSQTATFLLFNFVKGLAELTVITLFALLFVISKSIFFRESSFVMTRGGGNEDIEDGQTLNKNHTL